MLEKPVRLMIIGFVLLVIGVVFPFLMMLQIVESTFFLNFVSYIAQVVGLFLGVLGSALYFREHRNKN
jgi:hypothetical protein